MSRYLLKYKGTYRIKPHLDLRTNDFPRTDDGNIDPYYDDIYIKCANGCEIYHYGKSILVAYVPSITRGHNIIKAIAAELKIINEYTESLDYGTLYSLLENDSTIFNISENDSEIEFKFHAKNIEMISKYLKPQTLGADISPFSTRNLPKEKYEIPYRDLEEYKQITSVVPKDNKLRISIITKDFISQILSKDRLYRSKDIKKDMRQKKITGKEYIHSMGYWNQYLDYLRSNL